MHYCQNRVAVERVQASLEAASAQAVCVASPLDSEDTCARLWERVSAELGTPDGIALCGGRVPWKPWRDVSHDDWSSALFEHCVAPFTVTRLAVPRMQERGGGCVVYLSSIAAKYGGSSETVHYAGAKAALEAAMRGLARDVAKSGVRINGVRAGFVHSPQQAGRSAQEIAERVRKIPMSRAGLPEEVAAAVAFLMSAEASFVTAEIVTVAGGD